jgi:hypothetical protein
MKHSPATSVREEVLEQAAAKLVASIHLPIEIVSGLQGRLQMIRANCDADASGALKGAELRKAKLRERLGNLTDAYVDGVLDRNVFEERKASLLADLAELDQSIRDLASGKQPALDDVEKKLELASSALLSYETGLPQDKRDLLNSVTSNCVAHGKSVELEPCEPFKTVADATTTDTGAPSRATPRTLDALLDRLVQISTHGEHRLTKLGTDEVTFLDEKRVKKV